jgi:hypothetical protein
VFPFLLQKEEKRAGGQQQQQQQREREREKEKRSKNATIPSIYTLKFKLPVSARGKICF